MNDNFDVEGIIKIWQGIIKIFLHFVFIFLLIGLAWAGLEYYLDGYIQPSRSDNVVGAVIAYLIIQNYRIVHKEDTDNE